MSGNLRGELLAQLVRKYASSSVCRYGSSGRSLASSSRFITIFVYDSSTASSEPSAPALRAALGKLSVGRQELERTVEEAAALEESHVAGRTSARLGACQPAGDRDVLSVVVVEDVQRLRRSSRRAGCCAACP